MISIITPAYNGEDFIKSCLESVINQNCPNVEHIIIDGGSQDSTVEVIKQYAQKYSHIRWISEPDQGQSDAINKGIGMAQSNIIGILNVDDFYEPNVLNRVLEIFKTLPEPSFLVGNCQIWDNRGKLHTVNKPKNLKLPDLLLGYTINPHPVNPSAYFYHKSLHEKIGLYDLEQDYTMDVDFIYKAVQSAHVKYVNETWGNYRNIEGTKTYTDRESGQGEQRLKSLMNKYKRQVSPLARLRITYTTYQRDFFHFLVDIWSRVSYFQRNPDQILPSIMKKLNP